jgi:LPS-assembly protein
MFFFCLVAAPIVRAGDMCPSPPKSSPPATDIASDDHRIHIDTDGAVLGADGTDVLNGRVNVRQDARSVSADTVTYDEKTGKITVKGSVDFEDPKMRVLGPTGSYNTAGTANFDQANFQLLDRNGRGFANELMVLPEGKVELAQVRYTTCPVGNQDWMLQASSVDLDTKLQAGVAHGAVLRFKDVPIFYTPYISFPLGDERKSGFLFPSFGHSGSNGYELEIPYYLNLAPNYDLTLTPGLMSARGVQLAGQFRYLLDRSHGQVEATFLPDDSQTHSDRSYFHYTDITDITHRLRFDTDIASVSDSQYFEDFAVGSEATSVTFLERRADLLYNDDVWRVRAELQNFQTIDIIYLPYDERPYSRVPRVDADALWPIPGTHFELALQSEAVNFVRDIGSDGVRLPTGLRLDISPEILWSIRDPGYYFEPAVGYHFTQYDLDDTFAGEPATPTRALPYGRVDMGLVFDRDSGSQGQRTQTLEPRMVYSYVPYRNQDQLPIFDSGLPDLNLTELFRTNRFVGDDRIGDANQLAVGLTTRLFDHDSGAQYLSATLGQIRYFTVPRVTLQDEFGPPVTGQTAGVPPQQASMLSPGEVLMTFPGQGPVFAPAETLVVLHGQTYATAPGQPLTNLTRDPLLALPAQALTGLSGQTPGNFIASDLVAEVAVTAYKNWGLNVDYNWNPYTSHTDKSEVSLQYRPDPSRVVNVAYRFQDGIFKQWDGSFAWPIADHWNTVGRWVYSIQDHQTIEQMAGFEYKSCCWKIQIVQRRYIRLINGGTPGLDTSIALQLELTGLSSVGKPANTFLEQEIRGYSTRDPNIQQ